MKFAYVLAMCVAAVAAQDPVSTTAPPTPASTTGSIVGTAPVFTIPTVTPGGDGPIRCSTGTHSEVFGATVFDNEFESLCRPDQQYCVSFDYVIAGEYEGAPINITSRHGQCASSPAEADCSLFAPFIEVFGTVLGCEARWCDSSTSEVACNNLNNGDDAPCPPSNTGLVDVQLFPNCTLQQSVGGVIGCLTDVFTNYPYEDPSECGAQWDRAIACMSGLVSTCLDTNCPSILDDIPGFRSEFSSTSFWAASIKDVASLNETFFQLTGIRLMPTIGEFACPANAADADTVEALLNVLQTSLGEVDLDALLDTLPFDFPCPGLLSNIQQAGFQFIRDFYQAQNQEQVATAAGNFGQQVLGIVTSCDLGPLVTQIPGLLTGLGIDIPAGAFTTLLSFFVTTLPTLFPTAPPTVAPTDVPVINGTCPLPGQAFRLGCGQFYQDETLCGQRRAWLCDYADWKLHFLRGWVQQFQDFAGEDYSAWIPECPDNTGVQCRASQRCCVRSAGGCELCYCQGHDYTDLSGVLTWWRRDYRSWQAFFQAYRDQIATGGFPTGGTC